MDGKRQVEPRLVLPAHELVTGSPLTQRGQPRAHAEGDYKKARYNQKYQNEEAWEGREGGGDE